MAPRPPLSALLSQALIAFTIECDNEAEHQLPHRTTEHGKTSDAGPMPWLTSINMYFNCMQFVPEQGIRLRELRRLARTDTNLHGMVRWGYIFLAPDPNDQRPRPSRSDWLVHSRPGGRRAQSIWRDVLPLIEDRWRQRFGPDSMDRLRQSLIQIATQLPTGLPDCLPILGYGLFSAPLKYGVDKKALSSADNEDTDFAQLPLPALLARVLLAWAIDFERDFRVSLAISANVLRVLDENPTALRDLPSLTGISTELIAVATGWLARHGFAVIQQAAPPDRGKQIRLNEKGLIAQEFARHRLTGLEKEWPTRFGKEPVASLRTQLSAIVGDGSMTDSPLAAGLKPYPDGWRAKLKKVNCLPHYPMVSHRGGYPDGS